MQANTIVENRPEVAAVMESIYEPVNLDGFHHDADGDSAELVALENVYGRLAAYIEHKRQAMKYRIHGDIECALSYERAMEEHYKRLPAWARW